MQNAQARHPGGKEERRASGTTEDSIHGALLARPPLRRSYMLPFPLPISCPRLEDRSFISGIKLL